MAFSKFLFAHSKMGIAPTCADTVVRNDIGSLFEPPVTELKEWSMGATLRSHPYFDARKREHGESQAGESPGLKSLAWGVKIPGDLLSQSGLL